LTFRKWHTFTTTVSPWPSYTAKPSPSKSPVCLVPSLEELNLIEKRNKYSKKERKTKKEGKTF
jgi:hypothetical protein